MADNSNNSSGLTESTNSTIYALNESTKSMNLAISTKSKALDESGDNSNMTNLSQDSSIQLTDSSHVSEDFSGFSEADHESDVKDPFNSIFYHVMPFKDSTNIIFYNRPLYNNILSVLSKEFNFPANDTRKFQIKTHVDGKRCFIHIDKDVMSLCASGPGHNFWKENNFKKLSENMYRCFIRDTNSMLNTDLQKESNKSLSVSQISTQPDLCGLINCNTTEETGNEPPAELITQQPLETSTDPQDSPVIRKISLLIDMIHTLQGQVTTLTNQVNELVSQEVYRTVDETSETVTQTINETVLTERNDTNPAAETPKQATSFSAVLQQTNSSSVFPNQENDNSPVAETLQPGSDAIRTSTPMTPNQQRTGLSRLSTRLSQTHRPERQPTASRQPSSQKRNTSKSILLMGDSLISSVNPKGLNQGVFKHSIPGARIDHIYDQVNVFNMNQFSQVIIFVGGNDASSGTDIEYFEELYEQVIQNLRQANGTCQIYLCNICPRDDADTTYVNEVIHRLCQEHNLSIVDINKSFYDRKGNIIERYYAEDFIHLSVSGVKRLLGEINKVINIVANFESCTFKRHYQKKGQTHKTNNWKSVSGPKTGKYKQNKNNINSGASNSSACYKCGETNHETRLCKHKEQLKCFDCGFYGHKSGRGCLNK